jgi:acyl-CoA reductase-like NAD-dependent aldehyde dehydrogenase
VGNEILKKCALSFKKYVLEMGGSSPALVAADADLDLAVNSIVWGRFFNSGQSCDAIKRVFVESKVAQKFTDKLVKAVEKLRIGDPSQKNIDLGPLSSQAQLKKIQDQVTKGVVQGGRIVSGGRRMREEPFINGFYHEPTVMVFVNPKMDIMQEEVFGPVLPICEVANFNEAIKGANNSIYGLSAAVFTKDKAKMDLALSKLQVGMIYQNEAIVITPGNPWYGTKQSAMGVERGKYGLLEYTHKQHLYFNKTAYKNRPYWFPY